MLKWRVISIWILVWLNGCHHSTFTHELVVSAAPGDYTFKKSRLPPYNQISIRGTINVKLYTDTAHPRLTVTGNHYDLQHLQIKVIQHVLVVTHDKKYPQHAPIAISIHLPILNAFTYLGAGTIKGYGIHTHNLILNLNNSGMTTLNGQINLQRLNVSGFGDVKINGVSAYNLQIFMRDRPNIRIYGHAINIDKLILCGNGSLILYHIQNTRLMIRAHDQVKLLLAGHTNVLDLELWGNARFNGRYLYADRIFAKTHDHAVVGINASKIQHTLASDASDIYFYNLPGLRTDFMAHNGAVLDMRNWNLVDTTR